MIKGAKVAVRVYVDPQVFIRLTTRADAEHRTLSAMAALILDSGLTEKLAGLGVAAEPASVLARRAATEQRPLSKGGLLAADGQRTEPTLEPIE